MFDSFVFGKDLTLATHHPTAADSHDDWSPHDEEALYHDMPLSFMADFHSGAEFAKMLLSMRPGKLRVLDLGTATGSVPLTMRQAGMLALGLDGLDVGKRGKITPDMLPHDLARGRFAWHVAPEIVECCDITHPFGIYDASHEIQKFDYIISTDCFEHLIEARVPVLVDNAWNHLANDGYGIFEVNTGYFHKMHQCVKPRKWWIDQFKRRFTIDEKKSAADFVYARSRVIDGEIRYLDSDKIDGWKILFWCQKRA